MDLDVHPSTLDVLLAMRGMRRLQLAQCLSLGAGALGDVLGAAPAAWPHLTSLDLHGNLLDELPAWVVALTGLR